MSQFYAVGKGRQVGVYKTWAECQEQVKNFSSAMYKKFKTRTEAVEFIRECNEIHSPSKSFSKPQFLKETTNVPCTFPNTCLQTSSTSLLKSSGRHEILSPQKVTSNYRGPDISLLIQNKHNLAKASDSDQPNKEIPDTLSLPISFTIQKCTKKHRFVSEKNRAAVSNNDTEVAELNMIFERVNKYFADIKETVNHVLLKLNNLGNGVNEANCENTVRNESVTTESNAVIRVDSPTLSPQILSEIENWAEDDIFISESSETNSQNSATRGSNNDSEKIGLNGLFDMADNHFTVIKNTLDDVLLKINDLENNIEEQSCQYAAGNNSIGVGILNIARSDVTRLLLESYHAPQSIRSSETQPEQEIRIEPPKKRPRIEPNFNHKPNEFSHDFIINEDGFVIVYTDGACENNGRRGAKAGIGVWFGDGHPLNCSKPVHGRPTNNTAEIQAAVQALEIAKRAGVKKVLVHTDSQFTINCITKWVRKWLKNNWKVASGDDVINKDDLILLLEAKEGMDVKWKHVRGHRGIHGNEMADRLARSGALLYKNERRKRK